MSSSSQNMRNRGNQQFRTGGVGRTMTGAGIGGGAAAGANAFRSSRPTQRLSSPSLTSRGSLPPRPRTFNFAGANRALLTGPAISGGAVLVSPSTIVAGVSFGAFVPVNSVGFRIGFVQYDPFFHDSWFFFAGYGFWPYAPCVYSPWYYYPMLPPYLSIDFVFYNTPPVYYEPEPYAWYPPSEPRPAAVAYGQLDYAIDDIVTAYDDHDPRAVSRLVPEDGDVAIFLDGSYRYSIRPDHFGDMLHDSISDVHTSGYHVVSVKRFRDGSVLLVAKHNTIDASGHREAVYQHIRLVKENGNWVIREFGTSNKESYVLNERSAQRAY